MADRKISADGHPRRQKTRVCVEEVDITARREE